MNDSCNKHYDIYIYIKYDYSFLTFILNLFVQNLSTIDKQAKGGNKRESDEEADYLLIEVHKINWVDYNNRKIRKW